MSACGNGVTAGSEECDDGDLIEGDGCDANCQLEPFCGEFLFTQVRREGMLAGPDLELSAAAQRRRSNA